MTRTDLHLLYQKQSGYSLTTIQNCTESVRVISEVECPNCNLVFEIDELMGVEEADVIQYIQWLEERTMAMMKVLEVSANTDT